MEWNKWMYEWKVGKERKRLMEHERIREREEGRMRREEAERGKKMPLNVMRSSS